MGLLISEARAPVLGHPRHYNIIPDPEIAKEETVKHELSDKTILDVLRVAYNRVRKYKDEEAIRMSFGNGLRRCEACTHAQGLATHLPPARPPKEERRR